MSVLGNMSRDKIVPYRTRRELEQRIRELRAHSSVDPGDRTEIEGLIETAEAELRALARDGYAR